MPQPKQNKKHKMCKRICILAFLDYRPRMQFYVKVLAQLGAISILFLVTNQFLNLELIKLTRHHHEHEMGNSNVINKNKYTFNNEESVKRMDVNLPKCVTNHKSVDLRNLTQFNWYGKRNDYYLQYTHLYDTRLSPSDANSTDFASMHDNNNNNTNNV